MFLNLLFSSPSLAIVWVVAIFFSLTIHEFSHALVGKWRGDLTAEREGRLTLNPAAHIDPIGLIPLFLFGFGWAKPVPFNPYNLKNPKWDSVAIALAGPLSNVLLATVSGIAFRFTITSLGSANLLTIFLLLLTMVNVFLAFFNVIPVHPLDGSKLFFALFDAPQYARLRAFIAVRGPQVLLMAVFVAILTNIPVFSFIDKPAYAACNALIGGPCLGYFASIFGG
ncbi:site-2 protease family protein [Candidatus Parcubacteria bacterium]|nr:site-2 protease family protein [Candidatus Parcubacteria bacterium]